MERRDTVFSHLALLLTGLLVLAAATVTAMPPHPDYAEAIHTGRVAAPAFMTNLDDNHAKGICSSDDDFFRRFLDQQMAAGNIPAVGNRAPGAAAFRILALLVDFSDHTAQVSGGFFDTLIYGTTGNTVHSFYDEITYSQIDLVTLNAPSAIGWLRAPQTYLYYVGSGSGTGTYPNNSQKLVEDVVDLADPSIDFSPYDNDNNGFVDVLIVIHSGTGAEYGAPEASNIWSHKWSITPRLKDGVFISSYTIQPEFWVNPGDMTIGVYSHELGHGFGLPDLYDIDYTSNGIGKWGLMAGGSWNGTYPGGNSPAHPCAWSRIEMGVATAVNVTSNTTGQSIGAVETGGSIFRLWSSGAASSEYFLVENRQKTGYDTYLPGSGLLIWHIDENAPSYFGSNKYEWWPGQDSTYHYVVALEQADGNYSLEHNTSSGDGGDPFPGTSSNTTFNAASLPSSASYTSGTSFVAVNNISASGMTMTADLIVGLSASVDPDEIALPYTMALEQNYPNPFNPTTLIAFSVNQASDVSLDVFNVLGQRVRKLFSGDIPAGDYTVEWDGSADNGKQVASGIYFYKLAASDQQEIRKMVLVR